MGDAKREQIVEDTLSDQFGETMKEVDYEKNK